MENPTKQAKTILEEGLDEGVDELLAKINPIDVTQQENNRLSPLTPDEVRIEGRRFEQLARQSERPYKTTASIALANTTTQKPNPGILQRILAKFTGEKPAIVSDAVKAEAARLTEESRADFDEDITRLGYVDPEALTPDAEALLQKIDTGGGVPAFMSAGLKKIAKDNGIPMDTSWTPNMVIEALREKSQRLKDEFSDLIQRAETFPEAESLRAGGDKKDIPSPEPSSEDQVVIENKMTREKAEEELKRARELLQTLSDLKPTPEEASSEVISKKQSVPTSKISVAPTIKPVDQAEAIRKVEAGSQERRRKAMVTGTPVKIIRSSGEQDASFIGMTEGGALVYFEEDGLIYKKTIPFLDLIAQNPDLISKDKTAPTQKEESVGLSPEEREALYTEAIAKSREARAIITDAKNRLTHLAGQKHAPVDASQIEIPAEEKKVVEPKGQELSNEHTTQIERLRKYDKELAQLAGLGLSEGLKTGLPVTTEQRQTPQISVPEINVGKIQAKKIETPEIRVARIEVPEIDVKPLKTWPLDDIKQDTLQTENWSTPDKKLPFASQTLLQKNLKTLGVASETLWDGVVPAQEDVSSTPPATEESLPTKRIGRVREEKQKGYFSEEFPQQEIPLAERVRKESTPAQSEVAGEEKVEEVTSVISLGKPYRKISKDGLDMSDYEEVVWPTKDTNLSPTSQDILKKNLRRVGVQPEWDDEVVDGLNDERPVHTPTRASLRAMLGGQPRKPKVKDFSAEFPQTEVVADAPQELTNEHVTQLETLRNHDKELARLASIGLSEGPKTGLPVATAQTPKTSEKAEVSKNERLAQLKALQKSDDELAHLAEKGFSRPVVSPNPEKSLEEMLADEYAILLEEKLERIEQEADEKAYTVISLFDALVDSQAGSDTRAQILQQLNAALFEINAQLTEVEELRLKLEDIEPGTQIEFPKAYNTLLDVLEEFEPRLKEVEKVSVKENNSGSLDAPVNDEALPPYLHEALMREVSGEATDPETRAKLIAYGYEKDLAEIPSQNKIVGAPTTNIGDIIEAHTMEKNMPTPAEEKEKPMISLPEKIKNYPDEIIQSMIALRKGEKARPEREALEAELARRAEVKKAEPVAKKPHYVLRDGRFVLDGEEEPVESVPEHETLEAKLAPRAEETEEEPAAIRLQYSRKILNLQEPTQAMPAKSQQEDLIIDNVPMALPEHIEKLSDEKLTKMIQLRGTDSAFTEEVALLQAELDSRKNAPTVPTPTATPVPPKNPSAQNQLPGKSRLKNMPYGGIEDYADEFAARGQRDRILGEEIVEFNLRPSKRPTSLGAYPTLNKPAAPSAAPSAPRDFDLEKAAVNSKIQAYEIAIEANKQSVASLLKTEQSITDALQNESHLSDTDKAETLKQVQKARIAIEEALKKAEGELEDLNKQKEQLELEEAAQTASASGAVLNNAPVNPNTNPSFPIIENLTPFDQVIRDQKTLIDLQNLLKTDEYAKHRFGRGTRVVTGSEIADRISKNILAAKTEKQQIDPYFFIPDSIIAEKVHELLNNSGEWREGINQFGTNIFEKDVQNAVATTVAATANKNPNLFRKILGWMGVHKKTTAAGAVAMVAAPFIPKLFALLLGGTTPQGDAQNLDQSQQNDASRETTTFMAPAKEFQLRDDGFSMEIKDGRAIITKPATISPTTTINAEATPTEKPANTGVTTDSTKTVVNPTPLSAPQPTATAINPTPLNAPQQNPGNTDFLVPPQGESSAPTVDFLAPEESVSRPTRPDALNTVNDQRKWLNETGRLPAYEQLLAFGEQMTIDVEKKITEKTKRSVAIEQPLNGSLRERPYWLKTILLQPFKDILPTNKNIPDQTINYRNVVRADGEKVRMLQMLDDNQYALSGELFNSFGTWYKNVVVPTVQTLESRLDDNEKLNLKKMENQTTGEYLTEVIRLAGTHGIDLKLPPISQEYLTNVTQGLNTPAPQEQIRRSSYSPEREQSAPTVNTQWAQYALQGSRVYDDMSGEQRRNWVLRDLQRMVKEYRDRESTPYSVADLQYLREAFITLRTRLNIVENGGGSVFNSRINSGDRIDTIIKELETKIAQYQPSV